MVRFKTRWLLLAIDDKPLATSSPFPSTLDDSANASPSATILSAAQQSHTNGTKATLTAQLVTRLLRASLVYNFGDVAAGAFGGVLTCKYYSTHTGTAIVRCSRDAARLVWASATLISSPVESVADPTTGMEAAGKAASLRIRVIHCGGTIKKVQNKAIELDRKLIMRMRAKQKRLAADQTQKLSSESKMQNAVDYEDAASLVAPVIPVAPMDDDEDLGEALDPDAPTADSPAASTSTKLQPEEVTAASSSAKFDPETQALLALSRKQINSISM
ncbi:related to POP5 - subunit of both RNase MRP and nuclear RNase P [Ustilago trichophora]|uniref:Related to POP5 - subunit of both RNase MRP and nuclear RNase P n=1 Tax=Ustilago trichophora TaxID=86804 RepID=A0A5C3E6A1_9BASI|nr:related to POP5 - subunit of both RNase MRP and nuclear RNase P [Ustilago trichophora]